MRKIFWAGDSISAHNDITNYPQAGLPQGLEFYIHKDLKIFNYAMNGRSTKSFMDEGRLEVIKENIEEGDFFFIKFGHNDEKEYDPARYTAPYGEYKENLKIYINVAKKVGATPVLITPLERRCFVNPWTLGPGEHGDYVAAMKQVAEEENVALIDLNAKSRKAMEEAGEVATTKWYMHLEKGKYPSCPEGRVDNSHLKIEGAIFYAGLIAEGLQELGGIYADILVEGIGKKAEATYDTVIER